MSSSEQNPYDGLRQNVNDAFRELQEDRNVYVPDRKYEEEIFCLPDCVQIFFISESGQVSTFTDSSTLRIFRTKQRNETEFRTFIQVGEWIYQLIPEKSPILKSTNGAFMFPDATEGRL